MNPDDQKIKAAPSRRNKSPHTSVPTSIERRPKNTNRTPITAAPEPNYASGNSSEGQTGTEGSEGENKFGRHNSHVTTVRRRHRTFDTKILDRAAAQADYPRCGEGAISQVQEASFPSLIANDGFRLMKATLTLPRTFYPIWKWLLLLYVGWLAFTYLIALIYRSATTALAPMCAIPIIGSQLPLCTGPIENQPVNASKVATSQEGFTIVMDRVGQNFDLARDMVGHEFAVRDLRIRVAASNLSRKKELTRELESLIRYTKQTAKGLSRFTAKVGKSIDTVKIFDDYAVKALEGIAERQQSPPTLPSRILSGISPFAAFRPSTMDYTEEKVKDLFVITATKISDKVKLLIDESFDLAHNLDLIQETLDRLKEIAVDEIDDLPRKDVLGALWTRLARPDDYEQHKSHTSLLTGMTEFYESSSSVMKETTAALNHVEAELGEFRDDFATPGLILKDDPLEVIIALLRKSGQRLEAGKMKLEHVEQGERPQRTDIPKASTRTVTLNMA